MTDIQCEYFLSESSICSHPACKDRPHKCSPLKMLSCTYPRLSNNYNKPIQDYGFIEDLLLSNDKTALLDFLSQNADQLSISLNYFTQTIEIRILPTDFPDELCRSNKITKTTNSKRLLKK